MNIKRNIIFALETRKRNGVPIVNNAPIRMRVSYARQRIEFSTGYRCDFSKWDADKQRVRNGCTNKLKQTASEINADLNRYYSAIQEIFKEFEVQEVIPTPDQLKAAFNARCGSNSSALGQTLFFPAFDEFTQEEGSLNSWTNSTYIKFRTIRNHFREFDQALSFEFFDESGLAKFVAFLRDRKGMRNSTVLKDLAFVKWFLRWAYRKGYTTNNACDQFNPGLRTTRKKVIFLTPDELDKIRNYSIPSTKQYLERVRDVFLFCCFTGLRHSDVYDLKRCDIKANHIEVTTVKTADSLVIELNDHSRAILEKYKDVAFMGGKVLPVVSNQKMNIYLKELCQLAGIDEPIHETYYQGNERIDEVSPKYALVSTHTGRRTFICNALALGIPAQVVMKWTGHNDYKAMKPYIGIADDIKASAMSKFNNL